MTQSQYISNAREKTYVDVQIGGPGNPWVLSAEDTSMTAPSGGRQSVDSRWGRNFRGDSTYKGTIRTGNPARWTFDVMARLTIFSAIHSLLNKFDPRPGCGCEYDGVGIRRRQRCGDIRDINNYEIANFYVDAFSTNQSWSANLANADVGDDSDVMVTESFSAGEDYFIKKLTHSDVKGTFSDFAYNDILYLCDKKWYAVTDADNTPGYLSQPTPMLKWTTDDFNPSYSYSSYIAPFLNGNATSVVIVGDRVVVASPTNGVAYARLVDLDAQVVDATVQPWTLATGLTTPKFPTALTVIGTTIWGVGTGGRIFKSSDGGFTFELVNDGVTTAQNLVSVSFENEYLGWAAGASGTLLRYMNGNWTEIDIPSLSATINTVAVPPGRPDEVYVGTAGGEVYVSTNAQVTKPTFATRPFPKSGNGSIVQIKFIGYRGQYMFLLQSDSASNTRVLRDLSGGALRSDVEVIGDFSSPDNNGINAIALATPNVAFVVGEVVSSYGYIGAVKA